MSGGASKVSAQKRRRGKKTRGALNEARELRKQSERDEQLLANRIALLRQEEAKAWKKIQQTKERAEEILALREENRRKEKDHRMMMKKQREADEGVAEKHAKKQAFSAEHAEREFRKRRNGPAGKEGKATAREDED